jgi:transcriptional regulator with XRE-family HTH domain
LRRALGQSQQTFAHELLKGSIVTVGRWETSHPPTGDALLKLAEIADKNNNSSIGARFRQMYLDEANQKILLSQQRGRMT